MIALWKFAGDLAEVEIERRVEDMRSQHGHYRLHIRHLTPRQKTALIEGPVGGIPEVVDAHASRIFILPNAPERSAS